MAMVPVAQYLVAVQYIAIDLEPKQFGGQVAIQMVRIVMEIGVVIVVVQLRIVVN